MKSRNKAANFKTFTAPAPEYPSERIIRIRLKDDTGASLNAIDVDAAEMSRQFPGIPIITVYQSGAPVTMSVNQLVKETLLQVIGNVEA